MSNMQPPKLTDADDVPTEAEIEAIALAVIRARKLAEPTEAIEDEVEKLVGAYRYAVTMLTAFRTVFQGAANVIWDEETDGPAFAWSGRYSSPEEYYAAREAGLADLPGLGE